MAEAQLLTFSIQGEDFDCDDCLRHVDLSKIVITKVIVEYTCPYCDTPYEAESSDVIIIKQRH